MAVLKRVSPGSAFKIAMIVYALLGLIVGGLFTLIGLAGASMLGPKEGPFGMLFGTLAIVIFPIFYGVIGGVFAAIGAAIYNLVAGWVGGLEIDLA